MLKRHLFPRSILFGSIGLIIVFLAYPLPVLAGFQWTPPVAEQGLQAPSTATEPLPSPVVIQGQPSASAVTKPSQTLQLPPESYAKRGDANLAGKPIQDEHVLVPPLSAATVEAPAGLESPVQGFANSVPMAVALRQILPSEYGYSVAQDVDLNTLVSWRGGRLWRPTLEDMLREVGLGMREQGKMVSIMRLNKGPVEPVVQQAPAPVSQQIPETQPAGKPMVLTPPPAAVAPSAPLPAMQEANVASPFLTPMSATPGTTVDTWTANRGETLHKVLENWSRRANIDLSWQAEYDYPIQAAITLTGTFEDAVRGLLVGFQDAQPQPTASLHNNPAAGQAVLVVQVRGNDYNE